MNSAVLPIGWVLLALSLRWLMPPDSLPRWLLLGGSYALFALAYLFLAGPGWGEIRQEILSLRRNLGGGTPVLRLSSMVNRRA